MDEEKRRRITAATATAAAAVLLLQLAEPHHNRLIFYIRLVKALLFFLSFVRSFVQSNDAPFLEAIDFINNKKLRILNI